MLRSIWHLTSCQLTFAIFHTDNSSKHDVGSPPTPSPARPSSPEPTTSDDRVGIGSISVIVAGVGLVWAHTDQVRDRLSTTRFTASLRMKEGFAVKLS